MNSPPISANASPEDAVPNKSKAKGPMLTRRATKNSIKKDLQSGASLRKSGASAAKSDRLN